MNRRGFLKCLGFGVAASIAPISALALALEHVPPVELTCGGLCIGDSITIEGQNGVFTVVDVSSGTNTLMIDRPYQWG